jgi:Leucine-rich repeat (LRR) protein
LKQLTISYNKLTVLHSQSFKSLLKIETIDVSNNPISFVQKEEFRNMVSLNSIDLRFNKLKNLNLNLIQGCSNLKKCCLYENLFSLEFSLNYTGLTNLNQASIKFNSRMFEFNKIKIRTTYYSLFIQIKLYLI